MRHQGGDTTWLLSAEHTTFQAASCLFFPNNFFYNERMMVGPDSDYPELKTTKEQYLWHV